MLTNFLVFLIASSLFFSHRGEFEIPEGWGGRLGGGGLYFLGDKSYFAWKSLYSTFGGSNSRGVEGLSMSLGAWIVFRIKYLATKWQDTLCHDMNTHLF